MLQHHLKMIVFLKNKKEQEVRKKNDKLHLLCRTQLCMFSTSIEAWWQSCPSQ